MSGMTTAQYDPTPTEISRFRDPLRRKWFASMWAVGTALALTFGAMDAYTALKYNHVSTVAAIAAVLQHTGVTSIFLAIGALIIADSIANVLRTKNGARPDGMQWFGVTVVLGLFAVGWFVVVFLGPWILHSFFHPAPTC
jgi:hypothetical protein